MTSSSPNTAAEELGMPLTVLTPFPEDEEPHPKSIRKLMKEITANATSQSYHRAAGDQYGISGLVMSAAAYLALTGTAWAPMAAPVRPVLNAAQSAAVQQNRTAEYKDNKELWKTYTKGEKTLKQLTLQAVPERYLLEISQLVIGLGGRSTLFILNHLQTTYGVITEEHLKANEQELEDPWDTTTPVEDIFIKVVDIQDFADEGQEPIPNRTVVRKLAGVFRASGVMDDACNDWDKKDIGDKNISNLRTHMRTYNKRRLANNATAASQGYSTANSAQGGVPVDPRIAEAVQAALNAAGNPTAPLTSDVLQGWSYCWSHGLCKNPNHNSGNCTNRAEGHQAEATLGNMMGGNNSIRRKRNERGVFHRPGSSDRG